MILSNEPGYYRSGAYGIRIENLVLVESRQIAGAEGEFLGFETLTFVPIDRELVDLSLLTETERCWWNSYHAQVLSRIGDSVDGAARHWLEQACAPL